MDSMLREALGKTRRLRQQVEDVLLGEDGDEWERELKNFLAKRPCWSGIKLKPHRSKFLDLLSVGQTIIIDDTDGTETISQAKDVFSGQIEPEFKTWNLDVPSEARPATLVMVYELMENGRFNQFFPSLGKLNNLCLTQAQIKKFCRDHNKWILMDGWGTFFLFTPKGEPIKHDKSNLFVARVSVYDRRLLDVDFFRFSYADAWGGGRRRRVVVPQLTVRPL